MGCYTGNTERYTLFYIGKQDVTQDATWKTHDFTQGFTLATYDVITVAPD